MFYVLPGDPSIIMLDKMEDKEQIEQIRKKYAFDKPIYIQYLYYINDISILSIHENEQKDKYNYLDENKYNYASLLTLGNKTVVIKIPYLRNSYSKKGKRVVDVIIETLPNTIILATSSILVTIMLGIPMGIIAAIKKDKFLDSLISIISVMGVSLPSFLSSIIISWFFGYYISSYTGLSMTGGIYTIDDYGESYSIDIKNIILPSLALGIRPIAVLVQITRNGLIDIYHKDYMLTAYAKGIRGRVVLFKHAFINVLNPIITSMSGWFVSMLSGTIFVEYIFGWNGLGKELVDALNNLDINLLMGIVLTLSFIFVFTNVFIDFMCKVIDPRIMNNK